MQCASRWLRQCITEYLKYDKIAVVCPSRVPTRLCRVIDLFFPVPSHSALCLEPSGAPQHDGRMGALNNKKTTTKNPACASILYSTLPRRPPRVRARRRPQGHPVEGRDRAAARSVPWRPGEHQGSHFRSGKPDQDRLRRGGVRVRGRRHLTSRVRDGGKDACGNVLQR